MSLDLLITSISKHISLTNEEIDFFTSLLKSKSLADGEFLLREGTDLKYGARHLKRAIERHLVFPISNLIATRQIGLGDIVKIDLNSAGNKLAFSKDRVLSGFPVPEPVFAAEIPARKASGAAAKAVLETEAATLR